MTEFERHADEVDQAQKINEQHQEASLAAIQARNAPEQTQNPDGTWPYTQCWECGDDIPEGRLALAKVRCLYCQEQLDRKRAGLFSGN